MRPDDQALAGGRRTRRLGLGLLAPPLLLALAAPLLGKGSVGPMLAPPSLGHPMGTDDLGQDMLFLLAQGAEVSFVIGGLATAIALAIGTVLGLSAAFAGRLADDIVMRAAELTVTVPPLLLAIVMAGLVGSGTLLTAAALGFGAWPIVGRVARAAALGLRGQPHLLAARALGLSRRQIAVDHVLPAILPVVLALSGVLFSGAVLAEATLSFVGLADTSVPGWGHLMAHAGPYLRDAWWLWLFPGLLLVMVTGGVALLADLR
ncbi:ABC transporter permease [Reyranella sp.]|uniref:ABC transporter permease n=1 Tax=Reyranella sp. TaxID=1929291 RepID=UPI003BAB4E40